MSVGRYALMVILAFAPARSPRRIHTPRKEKRPPAAALAFGSPKLFQDGLTAFENDRDHLALESWRRCEKKDPRFALVHLFISLVATDPQEQKTERHRAQVLAGIASKRDRLLVKWLSGVEEEQYVPAIAAMNDLLASYPEDKQVAFLAGRWLSSQEQYEQGIKLLRRATELDRNYAPPWNQLAYAYANTGDYSNAFAAMERYTALLPKDPNPQDSYAEILRMAGNYRDALAHYRRALEIDPAYQTSQLGIADTFALMGEEATARAEYEKAIRQASSRADQVHYAMQSALTYVREKKARRAIAALDSVADQAQSAHLPLLQSEAYRDMALLERDNQQSLRFLDRAAAALAAASQAPAPELHQEQAEVLRLRAVRLASAGEAAAAAATLRALNQLANLTRSDALRRAYAGAMGRVLVAGQQYTQAVPYLEEDSGDPLSMQDLIVAYTQAGSVDRAHVLEMKLAALNQPTVQQALVVPDLRTRLSATKEKRGWLRRITGGGQ